MSGPNRYQSGLGAPQNSYAWSTCEARFPCGVNHVNYFVRLLPHLKMLPSFWRLLIDAHRSDVAQSFLIYLILFSRSIHGPVGHHSTPLLDSELQGSKLTPAVAIRAASYQPVHQLRSSHIGLLLQPLQYQTPYTLERVRPCPPCARHS